MYVTFTEFGGVFVFASFLRFFSTMYIIELDNNFYTSQTS